MTEANDYEKAKSECFKKLPLIISPNNAFEFGFHSAWYIQEENYTEAKRPQKHFVDERTMIAAMAMQGLLSNQQGFQIDNEEVPKSVENVAIAAVAYADALIEELKRK